MNENALNMMPDKRIALIAHDRKKQDLVDWVKFNKGTLREHKLFATLSTGNLFNLKQG